MIAPSLENGNKPFNVRHIKFTFFTFRAKDMLSKCYKLVKDSRAVFSRLMMLFSLHHVTGDEDEATGQQQM